MPARQARFSTHRMSARPRCLVVVPTYNEIENIDRIVPAILAQGEAFEVLVVDDGSPDGTGERVRELMGERPGRVHLLPRAGKLGLGTAYLDGFRWGLARGYGYLFEMDADFSHSPADLPRLLEPALAGEADVVIGSRYTRGGRVANWPLDRIALSFGASLYVRAITWMPVKDPTAGFKCYRREVLEALDLDAVRFVGYAFQIEMKFRAWQKGFRLREVPITFTDREAGASKMSTGIVREAIVGVLQMRLSTMPDPVQAVAATEQGERGEEAAA